MKFALQQARTRHLVGRRNAYLALCILSLMANVTLSVVAFALLGHGRIVVVPPNIGTPFWTTSYNASPEYVSQMALYFASLRLDVTPSNAAYQREMLLRHVSPQQYGALKGQLINEEEHIKREHIATAFFPIDAKVSAKALAARVTGDLEVTVGETRLPVERKSYDIVFDYKGGRLYVKSFSGAKAHG